MAMADARFPAPFPNPAIVHVGNWCTGFVAKPGVVLTAKHCVTDEMFGIEIEYVEVPIFLNSGEQRAGKVKERGAGELWTSDWAIITMNTAGITPLEFDTESKSFEKMDEVYSLGYGGRSPTLMLSPGLMSGTEQDCYTSYQSVIGGDSGSPLFHKDSGKVIGIMVRSGDPYPVAIAVPLNMLAGKI